MKKNRKLILYFSVFGFLLGVLGLFLPLIYLINYPVYRSYDITLNSLIDLRTYSLGIKQAAQNDYLVGSNGILSYGEFIFPFYSALIWGTVGWMIGKISTR